MSSHLRATEVKEDDEPTISDRLYRDHAAWLRDRVSRQFGDDAEDLVQETYTRTVRRSGIRHPRGFLLKVALNLGRDLMRRRATAARVLAHGAATASAEWSGVDPALAGGQAERLLLKQVLLQLPAKERDVLMLVRFEGMTYDAVAHRLGVSVKTVEARMSRALALCAAQFRD